MGCAALTTLSGRLIAKHVNSLVSSLTCTIGERKSRRVIIIVIKVKTTLLKGLLDPSLRVALINIAMCAVHPFARWTAWTTWPVPWQKSFNRWRLGSATLHRTAVWLSDPFVTSIHRSGFGRFTAETRVRGFTRTFGWCDFTTVHTGAVTSLDLFEYWLKPVA